MLKQRGYLKGVVALLLGVSLVSALACPPPRLPAPPPAPPEPPTVAVLTLSPLTIRMPGAAVTALGAGFTPLETVSLRLVGNWTDEAGVSHTNPPIFATTANAFGAFNVTISPGIMTATIRVFNVPPGLYTIVAVEGVDVHAVASAPLIISP